MTQSNIGVSTGTDKFLGSNSRSIGGTALEEQDVHEAQGHIETFNIISDDAIVSVATDHILQVMADGTNYTRLVRLSVELTDNDPAADGVLKLAVVRLTTAGTGGTALNDAANDTADSYGGDMRLIPTSKGTEGQTARVAYMPLYTAPEAHEWPRWEWVPGNGYPGSKPFIIGPGTDDGFAVKVIDAVASAMVLVQAEVLVTEYL